MDFKDLIGWALRPTVQGNQVKPNTPWDDMLAGGSGRYMSPVEAQTRNAITDVASGLTSPLSLGLMGTGGLFPQLMKPLGYFFGASNVASGAQAAKEGNWPKAIINTTLGAAVSLPAIKSIARLKGSERGSIPLTRYDDGPLDTSKPHGLYFTIGEESPHSDVSPTKHSAEASGSNVLHLQDVADVAHRRFGWRVKGSPSTGVAALRELTNKEEFERLLKMTKPELVGELTNKFPGPDYSRYYDSYELLEAYGGQLARSKGYDAIQLVDKDMPHFSEYVALTPAAFKKK